MRAPATGGTSSNRRTPLDHALLAGSGLCCLVAAWLLLAVLLVGPARAPESIAPWALVAVSLAFLAALGAWRSILTGRATSGALVAGMVGPLAVAGGAWLMVPTLAGSAEFEGYVLVVGMVAVAQGILLLAGVLLRRHPT